MSIEKTERTRREFFSRVSDGLCGAALASLLGADLFSSIPALAATGPRVYDLKPKPPHFPARAKSVIQLFMNGGPSQVDLFDPKPTLEKFAGQPPSRDLVSEVRAVRQAGGLMPSPFKFAKYGQSGIEVSDILPHTAKCVDDMAVIRSMYTEHIAHDFALYLITRAEFCLAGRRSARGSSTDSVRRIRTCRHMSCWTIQRGCRSMTFRTGNPGGFRRSIKGRGFVRKDRRC